MNIPPPIVADDLTFIVTDRNEQRRIIIDMHHALFLGRMALEDLQDTLFDDPVFSEIGDLIATILEDMEGRVLFNLYEHALHGDIGTDEAQLLLEKQQHIRQIQFILGKMGHPLTNASRPKSICLKRNRFGNFEHTETHIVFSRQSACAIGVQDSSGEIFPLGEEDIRVCQQKGWGYDQNVPNRDTTQIQT